MWTGKCAHAGGGGGELPYISYMGMCCCDWYDFQAVKSGIFYRNQKVFVYNWVIFQEAD